MKHKRSTRFIALILTVCLFVTMMPATAFATGDAIVTSQPVNEEAISNEVVSEPLEYFEHKDATEVTEKDVLLDESGEGYTTFSLGGDRRFTVFFTEDVRYENEAEAEGFHDIAAKFRMVAEIERSHEERYLALLNNVQMQTVFEKGEQVMWECRNCGHLVMGKKAPEVCPVCAHPQSYFEVRKENY